MLIDSHAHLNLTDEYPDLEAVHQEMLTTQVEAAVVVGIDLPSSQKALELACSWIFPTVGIHPQSDQFDDEDSKAWLQLEHLIQNSQCIAVGETGLDFYHNRVDAAKQKNRLVRHLEFAHKYQLPVVIHCREAEDQTLDILKQHSSGIRGVLHCWAGGLELAHWAIENHWYVSLAGNITFKNAHHLREATLCLPVNSLLVETDCPFLTPHPHRGQPNHPKYLHLTAQTLSELFQVSVDEIIRITRRNTIDLFSLPCKSPS